jgi:16S rRNA (cytidine1402-2'-O)-methyltransferase
MAGTLFVVATPIGNLEDLSPRARRVLGEVELVACEDTRQTARLLLRHSIATATLSCHKFNERERIEPILRRLRAGRDVALVCDGGTPCLSDPGALLVRGAHDEGIPVSPIPGPSAVAAILSVSGFEAQRFVFEGFLPHRAAERRSRLRELRDETRTMVLLEAPHRIAATLEDIAAVFDAERPLVLGRELTKLHERVLRGTAAELVATLKRSRIRGEITLAIAGASSARSATADTRNSARVIECWRAALNEAGGNRREALRRAARTLRLKRAALSRYLASLGE